MLQLTWRLLFAALIATQSPGCAGIQAWRTPDSKSAYSRTTKSTPQENADNDSEEEDADDAVESAADDRRSELVLDEPLDPWFGKYNYADKGRAIERNLR